MEIVYPTEKTAEKENTLPIFIDKQWRLATEWELARRGSDRISNIAL